MSEQSTKQYRRSNEPVAWLLFSSGGVVSALLFPGLIVVTGLLQPFGDGDALAYDRLLWVAQAWWGKAVLLLAICLPMYHAAHRIYHGCFDLQLPLPERLGAIIFYGCATLLSILACVLLVLVG